MYGQTNCWLHPDINYIAFRVKTGEVFISTTRAALNMAYQDITSEFGKTQVLLHLKGEVWEQHIVFQYVVSIIAKAFSQSLDLKHSLQDIMGIALKAPLTPYEVIYTLPKAPMLTIKEEKGHTIV